MQTNKRLTEKIFSAGNRCNSKLGCVLGRKRITPIGHIGRGNFEAKFRFGLHRSIGVRSMKIKNRPHNAFAWGHIKSSSELSSKVLDWHAH